MKAMLFKLAHRHDSPRTKTTDISRWFEVLILLRRNPKRSGTCELLLDCFLSFATSSEFNEKEDGWQTKGQRAEEASDADNHFVMEVPLAHRELGSMP